MTWPLCNEMAAVTKLRAVGQYAILTLSAAAWVKKSRRVESCNFQTKASICRRNSALTTKKNKKPAVAGVADRTF